MNKPFWVELGMLGIKSRSAAKIWFYLSVVSSILLAVMTFFVFTEYLQISKAMGIAFSFFGGIFFSLSSIWYWMCIKWMDHNGGWLK